MLSSAVSLYRAFNLDTRLGGIMYIIGFYQLFKGNCALFYTQVGYSLLCMK